MQMILVKVINGYQKTFSRIAPALGLFFPADCHFLPTCSEYAKEAIIQHGWRRGLRLGAGRVLRCHPFSQGGVDLVPSRYFNF